MFCFILKTSDPFDLVSVWVKCKGKSDFHTEL